MKLTRCTPASLSRVSDFDEWLRSPFAGFPSLPTFADLGSLFGGTPATKLATDVYEDTDSFHARFEVPGVKKEDVKIELAGRMLTVSVDKRTKNDNGEQSYSLSRSVSVPDTVSADKITAKLEDGVLTVTLPKQENQKPRAITVN